jgi:phage FluMu protein Com
MIRHTVNTGAAHGTAKPVLIWRNVEAPQRWHCALSSDHIGINRRLRVLRSRLILKASIMAYIKRPPCPDCLTRLMLARITHGSAGFYIPTVECPSCELVHQIAVTSNDPMKSRKVDDWLRGQLRAPI